MILAGVNPGESLPYAGQLCYLSAQRTLTRQPVYSNRLQTIGLALSRHSLDLVVGMSWVVCL